MSLTKITIQDLPADAITHRKMNEPAHGAIHWTTENTWCSLVGLLCVGLQWSEVFRQICQQRMITRLLNCLCCFGSYCAPLHHFKMYYGKTKDMFLASQKCKRCFYWHNLFITSLTESLRNLSQPLLRARGNKFVLHCTISWRQAHSVCDGDVTEPFSKESRKERP